jgi:hypothetical protein
LESYKEVSRLRSAPLSGREEWIIEFVICDSRARDGGEIVTEGSGGVTAGYEVERLGVTAKRRKHTIRHLGPGKRFTKPSRAGRVIVGLVVPVT